MTDTLKRYRKPFLCVVTFVMCFVLVFLSPPFFFERSSLADRSVRLALGLFCLMMLASRITKIRVLDLVVALSVASLLAIEFSVDRSQISNILSYYSVIAFYVLLFVSIRGNALYRREFLSLWINVAYVMSITSIIVFVLHQFTPFNFDLLNFSSLSAESVRELRYSMFGATGAKNFGFFTLIRTYSYFEEPQYAAFYFTINLLVSYEINKDGRYSKWRNLNVIAGLLTFSVTYYIGVILIFTLKMASKKNKTQFVLITMLAMLIVLPFFMFSEDILFALAGGHSSSGGVNTSYGDREMRMLNALGILRKSSLYDWIVGHGVGFTGNADRGIAIGFFHVLVERGVLGLMFVLGMTVTFVKRDFTKLLMALLYFFAFTWYVNHIYWMGLIALWAATSIGTSHSEEAIFDSTSLDGQVV